MPEKGKPFTKKSIGLEKKLFYKIYEIEGIKDLTNRKCALFVNSDETECFDNQEQFEATKKQLEENRSKVKQLVDENVDRRKILTLTDKIKEIKQKHRIHFKMDKTVNYSYLLQLSDIFCGQIERVLRDRQDKTNQNSEEIKGLFSNLLKCFVIDENDAQKSKGKAKM